MLRFIPYKGNLLCYRQQDNEDYHENEQLMQEFGIFDEEGRKNMDAILILLRYYVS